MDAELAHHAEAQINQAKELGFVLKAAAAEGALLKAWHGQTGISEWTRGGRPAVAAANLFQHSSKHFPCRG